MTDHWKEPLPPGVKNLDDFEIHFPEHNLKDYVMHSPKAVKQSDTNYDKDIQVDNVFIEADKHEDRMNALSEQDMLPDSMKDDEPMHNSKPEEWSGYDSLTGLEVENGEFIYDPKDPPTHWELES